MKNNRICQMLDIKYPIIEGGMAYVGNGSLAAAVSNGGGFGQIGSAGRTPGNFEEEILIAVNQTEFPFGVNLPISEHSDNTPYINIIEKHKEKIKAISISSGNPLPFIPIFREMGIITMILTSTVKHAEKAEKAGGDIIICEGYEAGGYNGGAELTTFALVPQITQKVNIPVIAAGGISNGEGMIAAMSLGADGVQMGTRFVATTECVAHENYKQLLIQSRDDDTTILTRSMGGVMRVIKSDYVTKIQETLQNDSTPETVLPYISGAINKKAAIEGDLLNGWVNAGQGVGLIKTIESAEQIVGNIINEANNAIEKLNLIKFA
ncbi:NAD(P)H-dependent flavin oxidoreductase [Psychrobacillus soli]|uniref:Probable nitronate monooxygenase n=1 Tax=Psychrobacillus soli TaxID=1543965 RepID=A0A544TDP5_9BACI|nr:DUF561 domain-containing protein [Psychrobacillus soli]TQR15580.1 DUF561 domain-containing protein [Psychrobacillus soli]